MVSRILISIALLCSSVAMSQDENGLTFNQVLLVEQSTTIPEGKVWKIESALSGSAILSTSSSGWTSQTLSIIINNNETYVKSSANNAGYRTGYSVNITKLPIWLPGGSLLAPGNNCHSISVIEFNTN
jgi:hypothetical protein